MPGTAGLKKSPKMLQNCVLMTYSYLLREERIEKSCTLILLLDWGKQRHATNRSLLSRLAQGVISWHTVYNYVIESQSNVFLTSVSLSCHEVTLFGCFGRLSNVTNYISAVKQNSCLYFDSHQCLLPQTECYCVTFSCLQGPLLKVGSALLMWIINIKIRVLSVKPELWGGSVWIMDPLRSVTPQLKTIPLKYASWWSLDLQKTSLSVLSDCFLSSFSERQGSFHSLWYHSYTVNS